MRKLIKKIQRSKDKIENIKCNNNIALMINKERYYVNKYEYVKTTEFTICYICDAVPTL